MPLTALARTKAFSIRLRVDHNLVRSSRGTLFHDRSLDTHQTVAERQSNQNQPFSSDNHRDTVTNSAAQNLNQIVAL
jgi:hypothetical protein